MTIPSLLSSVRLAITRYRMISCGMKTVVAVSGGPDSIALLHIMHQLSELIGISLAVAHLDHGFRPESSDEARFVEAFAKSLGLPFYTERSDIKQKLADSPENKQAAARRVRYDFLERTAREFGAERIAVGHNADDQAETVLMRSIRGAGSLGLSGILPVRGSIIRPLIYTSRQEIDQYLADNNLNSVTDPSNLTDAYLRNRLRLNLIPVLKQYNPGIAQAFTKAADILRAEDEFLDEYVRDLLKGIAFMKSGVYSIDKAAFITLPEAIGRRALRHAVREVKGDLRSMSYGHIINATELILAGNTGKGIDLPGKIRIEISYGRIIIYIRAKDVYNLSVELSVPGRVTIPETGAVVTARMLQDDEAAPPTGKNVCVVDMDRLTLPLLIRNRLPGDSFQPVGLGGSKKVKEYFIDMKLPRLERASQPILVSGDEIVWLMGMRADRRFAAGPDSRRRAVVMIDYP